MADTERSLRQAKGFIEHDNRLKTLEKYGIYKTLSDLKNAIGRVDLPYTLITSSGRMEYSYIPGDYSGKGDDVNIVILKNVAANIGALVAQSSKNIFFSQNVPESVSVPAQAKSAERVSVRDFGVKGDDSTDDAAAINRAIQAMRKLPFGSQLIFPRGSYLANDRLLLDVDNLSLFLDGARIRGNPWRYQGAQLPFGSFVLVTGKNCDISGTGQGNSIFQLQGGSEANCITFLHTDGGSVRNLTLDGDAPNVVPVKDDTFMTGINVLNARAAPGESRANAKWSKVLIHNVEARRFAQYGMQAYGDLSGAHFDSCWLRDNGNAHPFSVGGGVAVTRGCRGVRITNSQIERNKQDGILLSSAGLLSYDIKIDNNIIVENGRWGLSATEEIQYSSVPGQGLNAVTSSNNIIRSNGLGSFENKGGLRVATYDGVGPIINFTSSNDLIQDNTGFGVLIQTNMDDDNYTSQIYIDSKIVNNTFGGLGLGTKLNNTVRYNGLKIYGNLVSDIVKYDGFDYVCFEAGLGANIASATQINIPDRGDVFIVTGSTPITSIQTDKCKGRKITLIAGSSISMVDGGNLILAGNFTPPGNSTIALVCNGSSWIETSRSINV